jgi:hypothetical protein
MDDHQPEARWDPERPTELQRLLIDHLRGRSQATVSELTEAAGDADVLAALDAMEQGGAVILRGNLYALAPWLRDGAAPPQPKKGSASA